jgi:hypothetical protein
LLFGLGSLLAQILLKPGRCTTTVKDAHRMKA